MSERFVLEAVRNFLQSSLTLGTFECEVMAGPEPTDSFTGLLFVAIHAGAMGGVPDARKTSRREDYNVMVTVSQKLGWMPKDRRGPGTLLDDNAGPNIGAYMEAIVARLQLGSNSDSIAAAANALLEANESGATSKVNGLLRLSAPVSPPAKKTGQWFGFTDTQEFFGASRTAQFGGLYRMRNPVLMT